MPAHKRLSSPALDAAFGSVREALDAAPPVEPEGPIPLIRDPGEPAAFPVASLGPLSAAARAIHEHTQAPVALCAQSVLAAASLITQAHADALHPATGRRTPLSLFMLAIAESGERKSAVDDLALEPVRRRERVLAEEHRSALARYEADSAIYEAQRAAATQAIKKGGDDAVGHEADLHALGLRPEPPLTPMLICPDPTYEGYVKLTAGGQPSLGLFSDEGGAFLGGYGMNAEHRLKTASALSDAWQGKPIKRVRAGDGASQLYGRRLALHLMAQPGVAAGFLGDSMLTDQGLLSRVLTTAPASTMGTRQHREPGEDAAAALEAYSRNCDEILEAPPPLREGSRNELEPRALQLSPTARLLGIGFADHVERQLAPDGALATVRGFAAKAAEQATRIAGVLTLFADLDAPTVDAEAMEHGIEIMKHYLAEAIRLRELAVIPMHLQEAIRLWEWIEAKWKEPLIYPTPIMQRGPMRQIRSQAAAKRALKVLEDHRYLLPVKGGAVVEGAHRREAWRIHGRSQPAC